LQPGDDVQCTFTNEQKVATATATPVPTDTPVPTNTPVPTSTNTPVPPTNTPTNTPVIPATPGNTIGDVNKNGVVNAIDAQLIKQAEAGFITLANPKNADVNLDGTVNILDAFLIQQFVAGLIPSLPA
ncbi:MAG: dockerin type I repeat-containing protein, partial [Chloroflexi bacterium]|nr:dockerin type I repeat-containing protein [Chloroflexota bacterium]